MTRHPNYVPRSWGGDRLNTWVAAKPGRVLVFFALALLLAGALAIWAFSDPRGFFDRPRSYAAIAGALILVAQVLIYAPRAWRAARRNRT